MEPLLIQVRRKALSKGQILLFILLGKKIPLTRIPLKSGPTRGFPSLFWVGMLVDLLCVCDQNTWVSLACSPFSDL